MKVQTPVLLFGQFHPNTGPLDTLGMWTCLGPLLPAALWTHPRPCPQLSPGLQLVLNPQFVTLV